MCRAVPFQTGSALLWDEPGVMGAQAALELGQAFAASTTNPQVIAKGRLTLLLGRDSFEADQLIFGVVLPQSESVKALQHPLFGSELSSM